MTNKLLNEDLLNIPMSNEIDKLWQKFLDKYILPTVPHLNTDEKVMSNMNNDLSKILKKYNDLFKANIKFSMDYTTDAISNKKNMPLVYDNAPSIGYCAATRIPYSEIRGIKKQTYKVILNNETGYHMIKLSNIKIKLDFGMFVFFKYPELYGINPDKFNYNLGRTINSIVLHEIGHHMLYPFLISHVNKNDNKYIQIDFNNGHKPLMINEGESNYTGVLKSAALQTFVIFLSLIATAMSFNVNGLFGLLSAAASAAANVSVKNNTTNAENNLFYRMENSANELPIQYGYGKEVGIEQLMLKLYISKERNDYKSHINKFYKFFNSLDYNNRLTDSILKSLKRESDNTNNDPESRKTLTKVLIDIKKEQNDINKDLSKNKSKSKYYINTPELVTEDDNHFFRNI